MIFGLFRTEFRSNVFVTEEFYSKMLQIHCKPTFSLLNREHAAVVEVLLVNSVKECLGFWFGKVGEEWP